MVDRTHIYGKQFHHQLLREPDGYVLIACLDALLAGLAGEDQKFGSAVAYELGACGFYRCASSTFSNRSINFFARRISSS